MSEKIQKLLAQAGLGSRREIERWIEEGRVKINKRLATLGDRMVASDHISVDGRPIYLAQSLQQETRVLLYHKQEGEMCTRHDPEERPTVYERLPSIKNGRWISVGRLDFNTSGLLVFTNNGALANHLMHPKSNLEREYAVRIRGEVRPGVITRLKQGVRLEDGPAHFEDIVEAGGSGQNTWWHVVVKEGRNRLVRRLWEAMDLTVSRLMRVRYGNIVLPSHLKRGKYLMLSEAEVETLMADMQPEPSPAATKPKKPEKPKKSKR